MVKCLTTSKTRKILSAIPTAILLALSLLPKNSHAAYQLEVGADESGLRHELHYHWHKGVFNFGMIANSSEAEGIPILVGSLFWEGFTLSAGRIGLPLGLTPPAYSSAVEMPSEYRTRSALLRQLMGLLAVPEVGASVKYSIGNLDLQAGAFESREVTASEAITVTTAVSPVAVALLNGIPDAPIRPCRPLAAALNICDPTTQVEELLFALGFTEETINIERRIFEPVRHVGAYWAKGNFESALDTIFIDTLDGRVNFTMGGFNYHTAMATFSWQGVHTKTSTGQIYSVVLHEPWGGAYFRQGYFEGGFEGTETAIGAIKRHRQWSFHGGVEIINGEVEFLLGASYALGGLMCEFFC